MDRLRLETRDEHDAIERALDWERRTASVEAYFEWLGRLRAFHGWWEPAVAGLVDDPLFMEPRRKLHLLDDDLRRLSSSAPLRRGPGSSHEGQAEVAPTPATGTVTASRPAPGWGGEALTLATRAEALGSMYVLEGSTLGGKLIARRVRDLLGFAPRYHDPYRDRAGAMWRAFQARLAAEVDAREESAAVDAARRTFAHLRERLAR